VTATYNDPTTVSRDGIRALLGDTDMSQPLLQDEEIDFFVSLWPETTNPYYLAAYCAEAIAAKFAREIDFSADSQTVGANVLQEKYTTLAAQLRARGGTAFPGSVYVGGIDPWESYDFSTAPPAFGTQMHDNPSAGTQDYGDANPGLPRWWERL
jgi:hypothetical protein